FGDRVFKLSSMTEQTYVTVQQATRLHQAGAPAIGNDTYALGQAYIQPGDGGGPGVDITLNGITIPAGKTIVCYALSDVPRRILANRLANLSTSAGDAGYYFNELDTLFGTGLA